MKAYADNIEAAAAIIAQYRAVREKAQSLSALIREGEDRGETLTELRAEYHRASGQAVAYYYALEVLENVREMR